MFCAASRLRNNLLGELLFCIPTLTVSVFCVAVVALYDLFSTFQTSLRPIRFCHSLRRVHSQLRRSAQRTPCFRRRLTVVVRRLVSPSRHEDAHPPGSNKGNNPCKQLRKRQLPQARKILSSANKKSDLHFSSRNRSVSKRSVMW